MTIRVLWSNIIIKSFQRSKMICGEFFFKWKNWSFAYAVYSSAWWIGWYCPFFKGLGAWGFNKKTQWLRQYLKDNYGELICRFAEQNRTEQNRTEQYYFWVFWYQGIDSMPDLVQSCYRNLVYHYGKRVRLVTSDNLADYIQIPDFVVNKVKSGNISLTHFSDIVRCSLLAQYGGLWLDSTCWVTDKIPDYITQLNIYSSKDPTIQNLPLWSNGRWTGWLMGTNMKNYPLFCFCRDLLFAYWNKEDKLIDYLLIDFCLLMGYETLESIKSQMDKIPPNNAERNTLYYLLDQEYDEERFQQICKNSWCFKLSYKHHHRIYSKDGKITFYGKLIGKSEIDA